MPLDALGSPPTGLLYDCTLRVARTEGRVKIVPIPPEEVLTSRRAKSATDLPYVSHIVKRTKSDLLELGYDREQVLSLEPYDQHEYNTERVVRYEKEDDFPYQTERTDSGMQAVWLEENYIRVDWDGDGIAELRKIVTVNGARAVMIKAKPDGQPYGPDEPRDYDNEEIDEVPLIPLSPIRMPHKLVGRSVADLVMDLQLIRSVLMRQILNNIYLANEPRAIVDETRASENTYDDLLTSRPGAVIRANGTDAVVPWAVPFVADKAFPVMQYLDQISETRTGIAPHNQQIDANVINKSSSGLQEHLQQQMAAQRVELIARVFAETGVKELARRVLGLVTRYQQVERIIRVTGGYVPMDPRQWRNQMNVNVSVGLGAGNKDQILAHLMTILQVQQGIVQLQKGMQGPLVTAQNVYDVLERLTENAGFKESFFSDPVRQPMAQGQQAPDPEMVKAQGQLQIDGQRVQADIGLQNAKMQSEMALAQQRAQFEMQLERAKAQHAMDLERMKEQSRHQLALEEIQMRASAGAYTPGPAPGPAPQAGQ